MTHLTPEALERLRREHGSVDGISKLWCQVAPADLHDLFSAYEAMRKAATDLTKIITESLEALRRHIPEAHGVHPNPEYQIVENLAEALAAYRERPK